MERRGHPGMMPYLGHGLGPALVAVAHGTRDPAGPGVVEDLLADVRRRLPGVDVITTWLELVEPRLGDVMSAIGRPAVVVPLLLSTGYHVTTDLPAAAALSGESFHVAGPLGPDRHLARAMTARLREAGARWGDGVVLAAAGSSDPAGVADVAAAAELLRSEWGPQVTFACLSSGSGSLGSGSLGIESLGSDSRDGADISDAVEFLRDTGSDRVCVAPYLLAPGRFSRQVTAVATAAGAAAVAPVLGNHHLLRDLVVIRYRQGVRALAATRALAA